MSDRRRSQPPESRLERARKSLNRAITRAGYAHGLLEKAQPEVSNYEVIDQIQVVAIVAIADALTALGLLWLEQIEKETA